MAGRITVVEDGQYMSLKNESGQFRNPVNVLKEQDSEVIFILDIDGIEMNKPDLSLITKLSNHKELWVDAAPLTAGGVSDVLISGAERAVMGTKAMLNLDHLEEAVELSENIIFSLDYDNGVLAADKTVGSMGIDQLLAEVQDRDVQRALLFDLGGIRDKKPPDLNITRKLTSNFEEAYLIGHVQQGDVGHLEDAGLTGAIIDFRTLEGFDEL